MVVYVDRGTVRVAARRWWSEVRHTVRLTDPGTVGWGGGWGGGPVRSVVGQAGRQAERVGRGLER